MFTGIIETFTPVISTSNNTLVIKNPFHNEQLKIGQSIACNGACLSITSFTDKDITFDVLSETFRKTNLATSTYVNLERAMSANGRFEGHIVLGHVDEVITLLEKKEEESGIEYIFSLPQKTEYIIEKGSITLNGISLTIGNITENNFSVFLIPLTLTHTNFGKTQRGDSISLEYDYISKIVLHKKYT